MSNSVSGMSQISSMYHPDPISVDPPTEHDLALTESLEKELRAHKLFEPPEESATRVRVLKELERMVKEWIRDVSIKKGLPPATASEVGGKIFTFGSYRLGVHSSGADIDTLCVGPRHVDRHDFFNELYTMLKNHPEVTEITKVEEAFVPVQKLEFAGIPIDLVYARLKDSRIPEDLDLLDDRVIASLQDDVASTRSINGKFLFSHFFRLSSDR